jgi:restriction system protein
MTEEKKPKSKERAAVFIKAALEALKEAGGSLPLRDVKVAVAQCVQLAPHDLELYEKTGYVRWESVLHFIPSTARKRGSFASMAGGGTSRPMARRSWVSKNQKEF